MIVINLTRGVAMQDMISKRVDLILSYHAMKQLIEYRKQTPVPPVKKTVPQKVLQHRAQPR